MRTSLTLTGWRNAYPSLPYVAPLAAILVFVALRPYSPFSPYVEWPLQVLVLGALCFVCWPREIEKVPRRWMGGIAVGVAVFFIWVSPDLFFHGYRDSVLFSNRLLGAPHSSIPPGAQRSVWVVAWRAARATLAVPIAEELFWRGWLMRWLIHGNFRSVQLGAYSRFAFFTTAVLFASEHGPYWDVGLATGLVYNLWMIRTKSVADCILAHAITNGVLSTYVLMTGNWQYWM